MDLFFVKANDTNELIYEAETDSETKKTNLCLREKGMGKELIRTTICKIGN